MVRPAIFMGLLNGNDVPRVLDNADDALVSGLIGTDGADVTLCQVAAYFAAVDFFVGVRDGPGKLLRLFLRHVQDIERHALGALVPDARHALKLLNEPGERSDIICGHIIRDRSGRECSFRR